MAGHGGGHGWGELGWFILVLFIMFVVWYMTGGPQRWREHQPFTNPLPPVGNGEKYDSGTYFVNPTE